MFGKLFAKIKYFFSKEYCYDNECKRGNAKNGKCGGVVGGTSYTGYLSESCVSCPYFTFRKD